MKIAGKARRFAEALVTRRLMFEIEKMPFELEDISTAKLLTIFRSEINCAKPRPGNPWYPSLLMIEPSSACDLHCALCPVGTGSMTRHRTNMSLANFRSIMDEVGDHAIYAQLWMYGEPLLNPQLSEMVAYAREKNVATMTSTNGQHIQTREEAEALVASGLDNLIVALDGSTQESFAKYRRGGDISKVLRCIELVKQAKDSLGSSKPGINVRTVVMKQNEHQLPEIERLARQYGADMISRKTAFMSDNRQAQIDRDFAPDNPRYQRFHRGSSEGGEQAVRFRCRRPWDRLSVTADGTVLSCEYDYNLAVPWGHVGEQGSCMKAWWGREAEKFRRQFLVDANVYQFCANCSCGWVGPREATTREIVHLSREPAGGVRQ